MKPHHFGLEYLPQRTDRPPMADTPNPLRPPADWLQALADSDDDLAGGRIVPGQHVRQGLLDSIARIEASHADDIQGWPGHSHFEYP